MTVAAVKKSCGQIPWCEPSVLESTVELALEIAREGRDATCSNDVNPHGQPLAASNVCGTHGRNTALK